MVLHTAPSSGVAPRYACRGQIFMQILYGGERGSRESVGYREITFFSHFLPFSGREWSVDSAKGPRPWGERRVYAVLSKTVCVCHPRDDLWPRASYSLAVADCAAFSLNHGQGTHHS